MDNDLGKKYRTITIVLVLLFASLVGCFSVMTTGLNKETNTVLLTPPSITINFAGNLSDSGGPYWRPSGESDILDEPGEGVWRNGYYTNDSRQQEDWIYIHCTISDPDVIDPNEVWVNWLNETTWTNWTYQLNDLGGNNYDFNTSGSIQTFEGYDYSFDIVANDTLGNSNTQPWNKSGLKPFQASPVPQIRRYVQLNCSPVNIEYAPYYFYSTNYFGSGPISPNMNSKDRLHHDQGPDGSAMDTGFLLDDEPTDTMELRFCGGYVGYWFDESVCIEPFDLDNIYYHYWWNNSNYPEEEGTKYWKSRFCLTGSDWDKGEGMNYSTYASEARSVINERTVTFDADRNRDYYLEARLLDVSSLGNSYTDNDIYELSVQSNSTSGLPSVISNRSFVSFVIFNVPDNNTLNNTDWSGIGGSIGDHDGDGSSDWDELYVGYTNPFEIDTDDDGRSDFDEISEGTDPNDYTDRIFPTTFDIPISASPEWEFISFPIDISGDVATVLDDSIFGDGSTTWDMVQWYDAQNQEWKSYAPFKPASLNNMPDVNYTMGLWVHITNVGDGLLTTAMNGFYSSTPVDIPLYTGWNLVGFPSATTQFANFILPPEVDLVALYDENEPYNFIDKARAQAFLWWQGNAYWVRVTADCIWQVDP